MTHFTPLIDEITPEDPLWSSYRTHLETVRMVNSALRNGQPKENVIYLGARIEDRIIGHISIRRQPLVITVLSPAYQELPIHGDNGEPLTEMFVQSFAVEEAHQRQGYGRALQSAALERSRAAGCYQMRSWSSVDRQANYALKISMGFAVLPALYPMPGGAPISGVYFVKQTA